jgi:hypothetical protein
MIERLQAAGAISEAQILAERRNVLGNNQGWDGFVRKRWRDLVEVIWP